MSVNNDLVRYPAKNLVLMERLRQLSEEGFNHRHDALYEQDELARAAAVYALPTSHRTRIFTDNTWPWTNQGLKSNPNDRVTDLIKAGALIIAELDKRRREMLSGSNKPQSAVPEQSEGRARTSSQTAKELGLRIDQLISRVSVLRKVDVDDKITDHCQAEESVLNATAAGYGDSFLLVNVKMESSRLSPEVGHRQFYEVSMTADVYQLGPTPVKHLDDRS